MLFEADLCLVYVLMSVPDIHLLLVEELSQARPALFARQYATRASDVSCDAACVRWNAATVRIKRVPLRLPITFQY